ncbi:hypothetical protein [Acaryochloris sp. CCMEE 5410]|uniref:hypothetical protein n=1 Tax=Acaryochloris sp. CCMEE 5410 TaxID=310037 RepID=UPI0002484F27|nr:hypothetical protein [Acaryochloris sp. CCMEE 5410]KAI9132347.1 hypothetical protein ON05_002450 [Acaryochloris sp. CCMEE 5410]
MPRPGGNPDLVAHQFKTDRPEPLSARIQIRVTERMKEQVTAVPNWQEFVREAIAEKLLERNS